MSFSPNQNKEYDNYEEELEHMAKLLRALMNNSNKYLFAHEKRKKEIVALKKEIDRLQEEYDRQTLLLAQVNEEKAKLQKRCQALAKNQLDATVANSKQAAANSKTTFHQWIQNYVDLAYDYCDDILDALEPEAIALFCDAVSELLRGGFTKTTSENLEDKLKKWIAQNLKEETSPDFEQVYKFFIQIHDLACKAEEYKEHFYIVAPASGSRFDERYARLCDNANVSALREKEICRCYLPAVFFFLEKNIAACAPALVEVKAEKNNVGQ